MKNFNKVVGNTGESQAYDYLIKNGYQILETNYQNKIGEIDIIAFFKNFIVFVEVKKRQTKSFGNPFESVTKQKQYKIRNVATFYLQKNKKLNEPCRFDVISIIGNEITHLENAF